jgi:flagellar capping protein FliD
MKDIGVAHRLDDIIQKYAGNVTGRFVQRAGSPDSVLPSRMLERLQEMDRGIEAMRSTLTRRENAYFAKFSAMERAVMQSNQQMETLWSMFGW